MGSEVYADFCVVPFFAISQQDSVYGEGKMVLRGIRTHGGQNSVVFETCGIQSPTRSTCVMLDPGDDHVMF